jgi:DNA-binding transcriptional LysR family regulator
MDLNRLRYFAVVAETGTIRRAAELLHLSPTALSKAIKVLERELGVALVQPRGRGIALTDAGRLLARRAGPVLADLATLPAELTTLRPRGPVIKYASHEAFGTYFTKPLLDASPEDASLEHRYLAPGAIEQSVLDGQSDIGVTAIPMLTDGVVHQPIAELEMGIYGLERMRDRPFAELEFSAPVHPTFASGLRPQSVDGWPDDRYPRTVRHRITTTEAALELSRQGRVVAMFPAFLVELHNRQTTPDQQLVRIPDPDGLVHEPQITYVVTRAGEEHRPEAAWIRDAFDHLSGVTRY